MSLTSITNGIPQGAAATDVSLGRLDQVQIGRDSIGKFDEAMRHADGVQYAQAAPTTPGTVTDVTPLNPNAPVTELRRIEGSDGVNPNERALEGLELNQTTAATDGPGQTILNGLERIRGAFDNQISSVTTQVTEGQAMDVTTMMNIQREVVQYSVLVDVSSKLAGKSTQALDTLMKGQ